MDDLAFYIFAAISVASAFGVVVSQNIVRTALFLLGTLGGVAGLYFLLDANLIAVIQRATKTPLATSPKVAEAGEALLTTYLVPFEVASVLLLVVMIGAAYLAKTEK